MLVRVSSRNRRPRLPVVLRRLISATVGVAGVLVLSGSQMIPVAAGFVRPTAGPNEGQTKNYYAAELPLAVPTPSFPLTLPSPALPLGSSALASKPYGLASTAGLTASGIPEAAYRAYVNAANELARTDPSCHISWTLIAGIGRVESNHGRFGGSTIRSDGLVTPPILGIRLDGSRPGTARISDSDNGRYDGDTVTDRAVGPFQFLPGTWKAYGGGADPQNINAAALAAGRYLCAGGGSLATQPGRWAAVYRYNHSDSYVSLVLSLADSYAAGHVATFPSRPAGTPPPATGPPATTPGPPPAVPTPPVTPAKPATKPTGTPGTPTTKPTGSPSPSPTGTGSTGPTGGTPTKTPTPTGTGTGTPSPTSSDTPTPTPTPTPTATSTPTDSPTSPSGAAPSCDKTPTSTPTPTPTPTPTSSPSPTCS